MNLVGINAADGSIHACLTDGNGNLVSSATHTSNTTKSEPGEHAPDGSLYMTLTNGTGTKI